MHKQHNAVLLAHSRQANQLRAEHEFEQALHTYEQMIAIAKKHQDDLWQVLTLTSMGDVCRLQLPALAYPNRFVMAERYYRQALDLCEQAALEPIQRAAILLELGKTLDHQGRAPEACKQLEEYLAICRKYHSKEPAKIYTCLAALANSYYHAADYHVASKYLYEAIDLAPDSEERARVLGQLSLVLSYLDDANIEDVLESAVQLADRLAEQSNAHELRSNIYAHLGRYRARTGDLQGALDAYQVALQAARAAGDQEAEAHRLNSLGQIYRLLGQKEKFVAALQTAIEVHWQADDRQAKAHVLGMLGQALIETGDFVNAAHQLADAYALYHELQQPADMGLAALLLARVHRQMGHLNLAEACIRYALDKVEASDTLRHQSIAWGELARVQAERVQVDGSLDSYTKSITFAQKLGDLQIEADLRFERGKLLQTQSPISEEAETEFREAIKLIESIRGGLRATDQRMQFQWKATEAYKHLIRLLAHQPDKLGKLGEAYTFVERSRSRTFAELLSRTRVRQPDHLPQELAAREAELLRQLARLEASENQGIEPAKQHAQLNNELEGLWKQIADIDADCGNYVDLRHTPVVHVNEIVQLLKN